jgi:ABC-type cobalamin transport system ATPase subunit
VRAAGSDKKAMDELFRAFCDAGEDWSQSSIVVSQSTLNRSTRSVHWEWLDRTAPWISKSSGVS